MADVELNEVEQVFRDNGVSAESSGAFLAAFGDGGITFQDLSTSTEADLEEVLAAAQMKRMVPNELGEETEEIRKLIALEKSRLRRAILECTRRAGAKPWTSTSATPKDTTSSGTKVKIGTILDQRSEAEVERLGSQEINKMFDAYRKKRGALPHPDVEPTVEQISAMLQVLKHGSVPYTDFAVFGPRNQKKLQLHSYLLQPDCTWKRTEMPGPPDFQCWWKSYRLLKTLFLILDVAQAEHLDNYGEKIRDYHDLYGHACWWLIYQADLRMRAEEFERIRRRLDAQRAQAHSAGAPLVTLDAIIDDNQPWDAVFRAATTDETGAYWAKEVAEKAQLYLSSIKPASALTDEGLVGRDDPESSSNRKRERTPENSTRRTKPRPPRNNPGSDGSYIKNRSGKEICKNYNTSEGCKLPCPEGKMHQCSICLKMGHNAIQCWQNKSTSKGKGKAGKN